MKIVEYFFCFSLFIGIAVLIAHAVWLDIAINNIEEEIEEALEEAIDG